MTNNLKEEKIPEDFKRYLGSSLANGYYLDDDAREKQFEKIVEKVDALINQKEKEAELRAYDRVREHSKQLSLQMAKLHKAGLLGSDVNAFSWGQVERQMEEWIKQLKEELKEKQV